MISSSECAICDEIAESKSAGLYHYYAQEDGHDMQSRIIYEDDRFIIMPSLGPVSKCHLLLIPKKHIYSYACLEAECLRQAEIMLKNISDAVRQRYGSSMIFEHGVLNSSMKGSASCDHAHMHIVSCQKSLLPFFQEDGLEIRAINRLSDMVEQKRRGQPYFYYQENSGAAYLMDDILKQSQYIRFLVARLNNKQKNSDWKESPDILSVNRSIRECRALFRAKMRSDGVLHRKKELWEN